MDHSELESQVIEHWGTRRKPHLTPNVPLLADFVNWDTLSVSAKLSVIEILADSVGCLGSCCIDFDYYWLVRAIESDLSARATTSNRGTYIVRTALQFIGNLESGGPFDPGGAHIAIITPYLFSELEKNLRYLCKPILRYDGVLTAELPPTHPQHNRRRIGDRISNIGDVYDLALLLGPKEITDALLNMDRDFARKQFYVPSSDERIPLSTINGVTGRWKPVHSLHAYLKRTRNAVMHGEANVLISEAHFLTMLLGPFALLSEMYVES